MKTYKLIGTGKYCGGMSIVVAPSAEKAAEMANALGAEGGIWIVRYDPAEAEELTTVLPNVSEATVVAYFEFGE